MDYLTLVFRGLLYTGTIFVAVGTIGGHIIQSRVDNERNSDIKGLKADNKELKAGNKQLLESNSELKTGNDQLIEMNEALSTNIEKYQLDLKDKEKQIEQLESQAKKHSRNEKQWYDTNGTLHIESGSKTTIVTPKQDVSDKLGLVEQLGIKGRPAVALQLAEELIEETRSEEGQVWLTPYYFAGMSALDAGHTDLALKYLKFVEDNHDGNPFFDQARKQIEIIESRG